MEIEEQRIAGSVLCLALAKSRRLQEDLVFGGVDANPQGWMLPGRVGQHHAPEGDQAPLLDL